MIKRALLSTYKKDKVVDFAQTLQELGIEIISTGGTAKKLQENGIKVTPVEEITNFPEILNGRVKTLNPFIHGGILARRENNQDMETVQNLKIKPIDLVYVNLYPFVEVANKPDADLNELIEFIDIGGPTMIRSAAKNYKDVIVVVDESDLEQISAKLKNREEFDEKYRLYLASKAFNLTAFYDSCISNYLNAQLKDNNDFQEFLTVPFEKRNEIW